jgi:4-diphosphocytidyl-2-C-methyl-D-erythritol kinase
MKTITKNAYAKINMALDVIGRRGDGYHKVRMIMQTVDLYDTLTFDRFTPEPGEEQIRIVTDSGELTNGPDNLIYRAARVILDQSKSTEGVAIRLEKRIPIAAGMAGGSTDAAATFHGVNELLDLGYTTEQLCDMGVWVGADVPYCIMGGTALAEGIGEILTPLTPAPQLPLVIAKPEAGIATKNVYRDLDHIAGWDVENPAEDRLEHPDVTGMLVAIKTGDAEGIVKRLGNVLEEVTIPKLPVVGEIKKALAEAGAEGVLMSGSGPTVFAVFDTTEHAKQAAEALRKKNLAKDVFVSRIL